MSALNAVPHPESSAPNGDAAINLTQVQGKISELQGDLKAALALLEKENKLFRLPQDTLVRMIAQGHVTSDLLTKPVESQISTRSFHDPIEEAIADIEGLWNVNGAGDLALHTAGFLGFSYVSWLGYHLETCDGCDDVNEEHDLEIIDKVLLNLSRKFYIAEWHSGREWDGESTLGRLEQHISRRLESYEFEHLLFSDSKAFVRKCRSGHVASLLARECVGNKLPPELTKMVRDFIFYDQELVNLVKQVESDTSSRISLPKSSNSLSADDVGPSSSAE